MSYPFVAAKYYTPNRVEEIRALVIHMAEGGGTVSWLTHPSGDNSADYVIEYSGRIVQMVRDTDYSHSLHWDLVNQSVSDCSGTFGVQKAVALLGISSTQNPLPWIKAVEIEGFAKDGPNAAQWASLEGDLIPHVRARWPSCKGLLGHRDFMGYKSCPGCHIFDRLPHGPFPVEEYVKVKPKFERWVLDGGPARVTTFGAPIRADGTVDLSQRLAFLSDFQSDRIELIDRSRLGTTATFSQPFDDGMRNSLASYKLLDCADQTKPLQDRIDAARVALG